MTNHTRILIRLGAVVACLIVQVGCSALSGTRSPFALPGLSETESLDISNATFPTPQDMGLQ